MMKIRKVLMRLTAGLCAGVLLAGGPLMHSRSAPLVSAASAAAFDGSPEAVYNAMIALKQKYPEGKKWTNDNYYGWKGGIYSGGYGCAGFAFMLSDAAFGSLPARTYTDYSKIRVGDILRINNDTHSVIVLSIQNGVYTIAEGNYGGKIHWGRTLTYADINKSSTVYAMTRYPEEAPAGKTGDLDGDGAITADDAQLVLMDAILFLSNGSSKLTAAQRTAADITQDGTLTADDAQLILLYYLENTLANHKVTWDTLRNNRK